MKQYSADLRERLLGAIDAGLPVAEAARLLGICPSTIRRWRSRRRATGSVAPRSRSGRTPRIGPAQAAVLAAADTLLEQALVSYVYGGYQVGDGEVCKRCNSCLETARPAPAARLKLCPVCRDCSLDCSHFTELVYRQAGSPYPYLETARMLSLSAAELRRSYGLDVVGSDAATGLAQAQPGDLLVYKGHVVILERLQPPRAGVSPAVMKGDVVHATGGRDIKAPGQGIQRERFADLANFRGPLLRVLRHHRLQPRAVSAATGRHERPVSSRPSPAGTPASRRLRPVQKTAAGEP
jgi:transposase-like protein